MIITFTNVIGAIRTAFSVVRSGLKMWLGFQTSETLGTELVVNGDFATDSDWSKGTGWTISNGKARVDATSTTDLAQTIGTVADGFYKISFKVSDYVSGRVQVTLGYGGSVVGSPIINADGVYEVTTTTNPTNPNQVYISTRDAITELSIDYITVKELTQITPDKSGNNNVGELFTGKALEFDGNGDNVAFSFTTPVKSAVFWLKPLDTGLENIMWFGGSGSGSKYIRSNGNVIQTAGLGSVSVYVDGVQTTSVPLNQWSRVVVNFASVTPSELKFAYAYDSSGYIQLSNVQLYNENLSTDDIAYDYANPQNLVTDRIGTSINLSNLKGYWHLSEGAGSTVYDSSGGGKNGTINGADWELAQPRIPQLGMMNFSNGQVATGVTLIPDPNNTSQDIYGNAVRDRLNSLNLDGTGYAKVVDDDTINPTEAITVECWVYWINTVTDKGLVAKWSPDANLQDYMLYKESATKFLFYIGAQSKRCDTALSNGWNHIVGTYDRTNMKVYLNGVIDGTLAHTSAIPNTTHVLEIGRYREKANRTYSERIDDARIYDRALSATEIENNYNAGLSAHTN